MDYQQVIKENAQLLKIGKYKEVLHNIANELQAPYLPWKVEEKMRQMYQTAHHADL